MDRKQSRSESVPNVILMKPTQESLSGRTTLMDKHQHKFTVGYGGNGKTDMTNNHFHSIKEWKVRQVKGHKHVINVSRESKNRMANQKRYERVTEDSGPVITSQMPSFIMNITTPDGNKKSKRQLTVYYSDSSYFDYDEMSVPNSIDGFDAALLVDGHRFRHKGFMESPSDFQIALTYKQKAGAVVGTVEPINLTWNPIFIRKAAARAYIKSPFGKQLGSDQIDMLTLNHLTLDKEFSFLDVRVHWT